MYAAYGRNTIANARPKVAPVPDPEVRVFDMIEARRQRIIRAAKEERERRLRSEEYRREQKRIADELIAKGRAAAELFARRHRDEVDEEDARPRFRPAFRQIEARICRAMGVRSSELYTQRRHRHVVKARQALMYWACRLTPLSLPEIGLRMGYDHTTVIHGRTAYPAKRAKDGRYLRPVK